MTSLAVERPSVVRAFLQDPAVPMLQAFAFALMVFPSDTVIKAIGAGGYLAAIIAYLLFLCYMASLLFRLHNPWHYRSPVRVALGVFWLATLASYSLMQRTLLSTAQLSSADRWLIQLVGISGVILVASEFLRTIEDIHRVLRAFTLGGAVCGLSAAFQYWFHWDLTPYIRHILPGFSLNQAVGAIAIGSRSGLNRAAGTATDPIEMGVVAGMLLPIAIYLVIYDHRRAGWKRLIPALCIAIAIPTAISRAALLAAIIGLAVFIVSLPPRHKLSVMAAIPVVLAGIFMGAHRLLGTIANYFMVGTGDSSISHRVDNYPYAMQLIRQAPWFGHGGGTYIAGGYTNLSVGHILDDQYLDSAIELGAVGVLILTFYLLWPALAAIRARGRTTDTQLRDLCAALGGAAFAGVVASATFDSFGFPMFVMAEALVLGLIGAAWLHVAKSQTESRNID